MKTKKENQNDSKIKEKNINKPVNKKLIKESEETQEKNIENIVKEKQESKNKHKSLKTFISKICNKFKFENKKFNAIELIMIMIMATVFGIFIGEIIFYNKGNNAKVSQKELTEIESVYNTLITDYYGDITEENLKEAAIKGMMGLLGDNYSFYMNTEEKAEFNEQLDGEFTGLGVEITLIQGGLPTVATIFEGSAAEGADLKVGDVFLKVNNIETKDKTLEEISNMIKGGKSKEITLVIKRGEEEITKNITTSKATIPSVTYEMFEKDEIKTGYIYMNIFAQNTDEQFKQALENLEKEKIDNLIIDVRGNSGGHLDTVTNIIELFLDKDQIMYQIQSKDKTVKYQAKDDNNRKYKIAVLVNESSASASELLASALLEQKQAEIVGVNTFGKGTVQKTMELQSGGMIKYTSEIWLTSKGNAIDKKGVAPTIKVELSEKYYKTLEKEDDNQLQKALDTLRNK